MCAYFTVELGDILEALKKRNHVEIRCVLSTSYRFNGDLCKLIKHAYLRNFLRTETSKPCYVMAPALTQLQSHSNFRAAYKVMLTVSYRTTLSAMHSSGVNIPPADRLLYAKTARSTH